MIGSLAFMLLAAAATTPCESLSTLKLDKATIASAQMVPEGPAPARGGGGRARGAAPGAPAANAQAPRAGGAPNAARGNAPPAVAWISAPLSARS